MQNTGHRHFAYCPVKINYGIINKEFTDVANTRTNLEIA